MFHLSVGSIRHYENLGMIDYGITSDAEKFVNEINIPVIKKEIF